MNNNIWLEAHNVTAYKNGYEVIKNLNVSFYKDERIVILGPNGSGKSSIIELINRNIYPIEKNDSYLKIFNNDIINIWNLRDRISTVNNEIKSRINQNLKVYDLILSGLNGSYSKKDNISYKEKTITNNLIEKMSLNNIAEKKFGNISDGEKQISLIARAIINNPEVLILDEPAVNLDLSSKFFLLDQFDNLSELGINILCVTHDLSLITKNFNRVILLKDRNIIADGSPDKILKKEYINSLFNIKVNILKNKNNWEVIREYS